MSFLLGDFTSAINTTLVRQNESIVLNYVEPALSKLVSAIGGIFHENKVSMVLYHGARLQV